ncbi:MAG: cobalamin biosynthesis protein [Clostridium sp.]
MKIGIISHSKDGWILSLRIKELLEPLGYIVNLFTSKKDIEGEVLPLKEFSKTIFSEYDFGVFIGSIAIGVRGIAEFIQGKLQDPGIIVIDDLGKNVIPILSGHIGGANRLSRIISNGINSGLVLTTGSDIRGIIPIDEFASVNNLYIDGLDKAKLIASKIINGDNVSLISQENILSKIPSEYSGSLSDYGVYIGSSLEEPFKHTLRLIPRNIVLGIGCRRGVSSLDIHRFIIQTMEKHNLSPRGIRSINSIDIKSNEEGLINLSRELNVEFNTYSVNELIGVEGEFTKSSFVKRITGVDNVCERAALINGGEVLVRKTSSNGITISIVRIKGGVSFEY